MSIIQPGVIAIPTYLLSDDELRDIRLRLKPFAEGDEDHTDQPEGRAWIAIWQIEAELAERGAIVDVESLKGRKAKGGTK